VNSSGVFSGLTNLRNPNPDPTRKSRGLVVLEALQADSAEEAIEALRGLAKGAYNPFNCFVADGDRAFVVVYQDAPDGLAVHELEPGVHVIGNAEAAGPVIPKVERISRLAQRAAAEPAENVLNALADVCREHGNRATGEKENQNDPLTDACVHVADTYGTRSSLLLQLSESSEQSRLMYADGPPCTEEYQDFSSLLHELRQKSRYGAAENPTRNAS